MVRNVDDSLFTNCATLFQIGGNMTHLIFSYIHSFFRQKTEEASNSFIDSGQDRTTKNFINPDQYDVRKFAQGEPAD